MINEEIARWRAELDESRRKQDERFKRHDRLLRWLLVALLFVGAANLVSAGMHVARMAVCR